MSFNLDDPYQAARFLASLGYARHTIAKFLTEEHELGPDDVTIALNGAMEYARAQDERLEGESLVARAEREDAEKARAAEFDLSKTTWAN